MRACLRRLYEGLHRHPPLTQAAWRSFSIITLATLPFTTSIYPVIGVSILASQPDVQYAAAVKSDPDDGFLVLYLMCGQ